MDEVIVPIRMRIGDLVIIWQLAQRDRRTVEDWIMNCVAEKIQNMQKEWFKQQKSEEEKGGEA